MAHNLSKQRGGSINLARVWSVISSGESRKGRKAEKRFYQKQSLACENTESYSLLHMLNEVTFVLSRLRRRIEQAPGSQPGSKLNAINTYMGTRARLI
jgi:hypothetical protein